MSLERQAVEDALSETIFAFDSSDFDELRRLSTDDYTYCLIAPDGSREVVFQGLDTFIAGAQAANAGMHFVQRFWTNMVTKVDGDTARVKANNLAVHAARVEGEDPKPVYHAARIEFEMRKEGGQWKTAAIAIEPTWTDPWMGDMTEVPSRDAEGAAAVADEG